eukprot:Nk52_evm8s2325 gene=Nk52_evmTU8s2325
MNLKDDNEDSVHNDFFKGENEETLHSELFKGVEEDKGYLGAKQSLDFILDPVLLSELRRVFMEWETGSRYPNVQDGEFVKSKHLNCEGFEPGSIWSFATCVAKNPFREKL